MDNEFQSTMDNEQVIPRCKDLYDGMPKLSFFKNETVSTRHISSHLPIDEEIQSLLAILNLEDKIHLNKVSAFLVSFDSDYTVRFHHEKGIQHHVLMLFRNLLVMLGMSAGMFVDSDHSIMNQHNSKVGNNPDMLILWKSDAPIGIILVKCPPSDDDARYGVTETESNHILADSKVVGQAYDYGLALQHYYGLEEVLVVITTLKDWKVLRLTRPRDLPHSVGDTPPTPLQRIVYSTSIICHTDPTLVPTLLSAIVTAVETPPSPVPFCSSRRLYVQCDTLGWRWVRLPAEQLRRLTDGLSLNMATRAAVDEWYTVLRPLQSCATRKVWLCLAGTSSSLCVVKQVDTTEEATYQARLWNEVNGHAATYTTTVDRTPAIVTPLVFCAAQANDGTVSFNFDVAVWGVASGAITDVPDCLTAQLRHIQQLTISKGLVNPLVAATAAVTAAALQQIEHKDLAWRHVAILPVYEMCDGVCSVVDVRAALIDFDSENSAIEVPTDTAQENMMTKLAKLCVGRTFSNFKC